MFGNRAISAWLSRAHPVVFSAYAICAAFSTYFCMYAFRKPFAAGTFDGEVDLPGVGPIGYKTLFIISQVLGYCCSKFLGIKIISELTPARRAVGIVIAIAIAWLGLLLFAVLPPPINALALVLNGLPLGMVWGLVFGFLEGRRLSEVLGAGLSVSYIVASGYVKAVGRWLVDQGIDEYWMPFTTGALFVVPMLFFVWMLSNLPPPSHEDEAARSKRVPMDAAARSAFFRKYMPGLLALTALYILLTAYRDFRDNFAVEIWAAIGYAEKPSILATSENWVALGVLITLAVLMAIKDNRTALIAVHGIMLFGTLLVGGSTALWQLGLLDPAWWMILVGLGLYMAYVPYGCVLFDRLFAAVGAAGTAGFLIYVTDAFGYAGSVVLLLYKDLGQPDLSWLEFFTAFSYVTSAVCSTLFAVSAVYFFSRARPSPDQADAA
ncbi:MAG: hypothetical protein ACI8PZ_004387 [Myxococcota bacterium]|jgi:hypothetical protein